MSKKVALEIQIVRGADTKRTIDEIAGLELKLDALNKQLRTAKREGNAPAYTALRRDVAEVKTNLSGMNAELREQQKAFKALSFAPGSYQALSAQLSKTKKEFQALSAEARNGIAGRDLLGRIRTLDGQLKKIDSSVGVYSRNVGNYANAFRSLGGIFAGLGVTLGVAGLTRLVQSSVKTFQEFQQETATLAAISGAAGDQLASLERQAQRLGETTQFTAVQVAQLQTSFARTGFDPTQILSATEATVNLAIATRESVTEAADVVGAAVKGFSLAASETNRVTDVMTASFNNSRLNLERWREAQKFVAPVAASLNIDIEATAAAMAALADAGLEGSSVGTGLRRVLVDLGNENSKLSKFLGFSVKSSDDFTRAMEALSDANLDSTKSYELVGRIGQTALLNLANRGRDIVRANGETVRSISTLTEAFRAAEGTAARTAKIVGDTLAQDILKARSAIEGLQINTTKLANEGLRGTVQGFTALVDVLNRWIKVPVSQQIANEQQELNGLVTALTMTNEGESRRADLITIIQAKYPEFLKSVNIETASTEELQAALSKVNEEYTARILLQRLAEDVEKRQERLQRTQIKTTEATIRSADALVEARRFLKDDTLEYTDAIAALEKQAKTTFDAESKRTIDLNAQAGLLRRLREEQNRLNVSQRQQAKATGELADAENKRSERLATIREQFPELAGALDEINASTETVTKQTSATGETVEGLRAKLKELRAELEDTPEGTLLYEELASDIEQVEKRLNALLGLKGKKAEVLVSGSLKALQKELSDLQAELDNAPAGGLKYEAALKGIQEAQKRLNDELKKRELLTFRAEDFAGDPAEIDKAVKRLEDRLKFEASVIEIKAEVGVVDTEKAELAIVRVQSKRLDSLRQQLRDGIVTETEYATQKERINQESDLAISRLRLASLEVGSSEYLRQAQEVADKEIDIERRKTEEIRKIEDDERQARIGATIDAANSIAGALVQIEGNRLRREIDQRLDAIDTEYEKRIENAQGNADLVATLEQEKEERIRAVEKEAAQRRKEIAIKEAIIQSALAAVRTTANLGFPAAIPALIAQAVALAAQLAVIESQQFARGGKVRGRSHAQGGERFTVSSTGQRVELEGGEAVINKRSIQSGDRMTVSGTPAEIANQINTYKGYGDPFPGIARRFRPVKMGKAGMMLEAGGVIPRTPQFVNPNSPNQGGGSLIAMMTDEQIDRIADRLAEKTARETGQAVKTSLNDANRASERQKFVTAKTGIR